MTHFLDKTAKMWSFYGPPASPSKEDLLYFEKFIHQTIKNKKKPKILILGATPEFRELLLKFSLTQDAQITLIDLNPTMIKGMDALIHFPNRKEKKNVGNWLKMPFSDKLFDVIIGDVVLEHINRKDKDLMLENIYRILKPNGGFIVRLAIILNKFKRYNIKKELKRYANLYLSSKLDLKTAINYLNGVVWRASIFKNKERIIWMRPILKELSKLKPKTEIEKLFINKILTIQKPTIDYKWWPETKKDYEKMFKKYFFIKKVVFSQDYPFGDSSPIYYLIKK